MANSMLPQHVLSEKRKGNDLFRAKDYQAAILQYSKALNWFNAEKHDNEKAKILSNRALAYFKKQSFEECIKDCSEAIEIDPSFQKVWYRRGLAHQMLGQIENAVSDFKQSVAVNPSEAHGKKELEALTKKLANDSSAKEEVTAQSSTDGLMWMDKDNQTQEYAEKTSFEAPLSGVQSVASGRNVISLTFTERVNGQPPPHPSLNSNAQKASVQVADNKGPRDSALSHVSNSVSFPSRHQQRHDIHRLLIQAHQKPMEEGDVWYVIHYKWMESWRQYVRYEEMSKKGVEMDTDTTIDEVTSQEFPCPCAIDNRTLVKKETNPTEEPRLQLRLVQGYHYELIPQEAWLALYQWYGGGPALPRIAMNIATEDDQKKNISVQLYPELAQTHDDALQPMDEDSDSALPDPSSPITSNKIKMQPSSDVGRGPSENDSCEKKPTCEACGAVAGCKCTRCKQVFYCSRPCQASHWRHHKQWCDPTQSNQPNAAFPANAKGRRGKAGLTNLGNTCFMNSGLQCLSHAFPLTHHFLSNKWKDDVNEDNPLGTGGKLAKEYDHVIKDLWFGSSSYVTPSGLKFAISRFASQFSGFAQHDAQELLVYLLDGIHEDLNRVKNKPYVEMPDGGDGRPDKVVAAEAWEKYMSRNQSVVIDHFCGLFKSTLVCPVCDKVSIVFDPYNAVPLELPMRHERVIEVVFILRDGSVPTRYAIKLSASCTMADVKKKLSVLIGLDQSNLLLVEVYNNNVYQFFKDNFPLSKLRNEDIVVAYEILPIGQEYGHAVLLHRWLDEEEEDKPELFGTPLIISFDTNWTTWDLKKHVWHQIKRFLKLKIEEIEGNPNLWQDLLRNLQLCEVSQNGMRYKKENTDAEAQFSKYITLRGKYIPKDANPLCREFLDIRPFSVCFLAVDWDVFWQKNFDAESVKMCYDDQSMTDAYSQDSTVTTLQHCFDKFTTPERLDEENPWYCSKCQDFRQATKTLQLWRIPNILILVLKRFEYRNVLFRDKLENFIDFPINGLDMTSFCLGESSDVPAIYDLFAVSNHMGRMGFGHYTAYAREWTDQGLQDQWYLFDDSHVTEVNEDRVRSKSAYILFYRRRNIY